MFVQIQCSSCGQPFDADSSHGTHQADCPHCGKPNTFTAPAAKLSIQHGAPDLSGVQPCPSCQAPIARGAVLCIHCGYNLKTGRKTDNGNGTALNRNLAAVAGAVLVLVAAGAAYLLWPESQTPPPAPVSSAPPTAVEPPPPPAAPPAPAAAPEAPLVEAPAALPIETNAPAMPAGPTPGEIAAQEAEAARAAFEEKKFEAEQNLRFQLDTRQPLYVQNERVELRRKNGIVDKGTLTGFAGAGTGRVALVATPIGEIGVPLAALDTPSRLRLDEEYREAYIQHMMGTQSPGAPAGNPAE